MAGDTGGDAGATEDYSDATSTFGDRLALAREAMGLDAAELARRIGVKLKTLRDWEDDRAEPRSNRLQMLAGMLNVSMIWLMSGRGAAPSLQGPAPGDRAASGLLAELRSLRADQLQIVERMTRLEERLTAAVE